MILHNEGRMPSATVSKSFVVMRRRGNYFRETFDGCLCNFLLGSAPAGREGREDGVGDGRKKR